MAERRTLGVGIIGAGSIADLHVRSWQGVRDADIVAVASRSLSSASALAAVAEQSGVGSAVAVYDDVAALVRDPRVEAIWVLTPNNVRLDVVQAVHEECSSGRATLKAIAVEKPLGRTVAEAAAVLDLVEHSGLLHAYLENQVHTPSLTQAHARIWSAGAGVAGSPFLARCTGEHSGPQSAWFWDGTIQGGGVLTDMLCHAVETGRFLLTPPGQDPSTWLTPVSVTATTESLKWSRSRYAQSLQQRWPGSADYTSQPSEDYAQATFRFTNGEGEPVIVEATTSWNYIGAGLHLSFNLLGPEYSMTSNTLSSESSIFLSPNLRAHPTDDAAEPGVPEAGQGLVPIVDECASFGYTAQNAALATHFLRGEQPVESLTNGLQVVELLMAAYMSAQTGQTVTWPVDLEHFIPDVAQGTWNPRIENR